MEDRLFIVLYRYGVKDRWQPKVDGCFSERLLAENLIEILSGINPAWQYAIVEGPITNPAQMAAQEAAPGTF